MTSHQEYADAYDLKIAENRTKFCKAIVSPSTHGHLIDHMQCISAGRSGRLDNYSNRSNFSVAQGGSLVYYSAPSVNWGDRPDMFVCNSIPSSGTAYNGVTVKLPTFKRLAVGSAATWDGTRAFAVMSSAITVTTEASPLNRNGVLVGGVVEGGMGAHQLFGVNSSTLSSSVVDFTFPDTAIVGDFCLDGEKESCYLANGGELMSRLPVPRVPDQLQPYSGFGRLSGKVLDSTEAAAHIYYGSEIPSGCYKITANMAATKKITVVDLLGNSTDVTFAADAPMETIIMTAPIQLVVTDDASTLAFHTANANEYSQGVHIGVLSECGTAQTISIEVTAAVVRFFDPTKVRQYLTSNTISLNLDDDLLSTAWEMSEIVARVFVGDASADLKMELSLPYHALFANQRVAFENASTIEGGAGWWKKLKSGIKKGYNSAKKLVKQNIIPLASTALSVATGQKTLSQGLGDVVTAVAGTKDATSIARKIADGILDDGDRSKLDSIIKLSQQVLTT